MPHYSGMLQTASYSILVLARKGFPCWVGKNLDPGVDGTVQQACQIEKGDHSGAVAALSVARSMTALGQSRKG